MTREIVLDTETTGLDPASGHRIVEIGCVELVNAIPTGQQFHKYLNPERDMPIEAERVHGLSAAFLKNHPVFAEVAAEFLDFVGEARLVIHNAEFDLKFLNAELSLLGFKPFSKDRALDTVRLARQKFPGAPASLDALCKRFNIDLSGRDLHGALLDAELLAQVYLELIGGRQVGLDLAADGTKLDADGLVERIFRAPRPHAPSAEEEEAHNSMVSKLKNSLWG